MAPGVLFDSSDTSATTGASGSNNERPRSLPSSANTTLLTNLLRERQQLAAMTDPVVCDQYTNLPSALLSSLKREKKPFTYTPGGIDLSEIKSPRMQKRLEANKKLEGVSSLPKPPESNSESQASKELLVLPVYNSPIDLYSSQNAKEEFQKQANLVVQELEGLRLPSNYNSGQDDGLPKYSQSRSFRLLQLMTDTTDETEYEDRALPKNVEEDEMRFTGIQRDAVPSKFFHTLQHITGTDGLSPEPSTEAEYGEVPCSVQNPMYGKDFIPPPKPYKPFGENFVERAVEKPVGNITQKSVQNKPHHPQPAHQNETNYIQNKSGGYTNDPSLYKQKNPQPYIRPSFQAKQSASSNVSWQPSSHPYNYCTLPRTCRGIPGLDGTDL